MTATWADDVKLVWNTVTVIIRVPGIRNAVLIEISSCDPDSRLPAVHGIESCDLTAARHCKQSLTGCYREKCRFVSNIDDVFLRPR